MSSSVISLEAEVLPAFQLKGALYPFTTLQVLSADMQLLDEQLRQKLQQAPQFFKQAPVILDLQKINSNHEMLDFEQLLALLRLRQLIVVGLKGANEDQQANARKIGLAVLHGNQRSAELASQTATPTVETPAIEVEISSSSSKIITEPVRSGQQIYARGGDLIILAQVSQGAEILADGNIHVYGPLRGRALAGITGNTQARIFCQSLEAELISIAGQYKLSEDIEAIAWKIAAVISLEESRLQIQAL
jgi:septum site-determining protein MinC